jgi:hypothetical protein
MSNAKTTRDLWKERFGELAKSLNGAVESGWFEDAPASGCSPDRCAMRVIDGSLVILIGTCDAVNRTGARLGFDPISKNKPE